MKRFWKIALILCLAAPVMAVDAQDVAAPAAAPSGGDVPPAGSGAPIAEAGAAEAPSDAAAGNTASDAAAPAKSNNRLVEEVIVTAQKREEKILSVPLSVQAFSAESLDARGITDASGLQRATPGLDVGSQAGFATVFLRGVGTEAFLTADQSVASYIDGVYYSFSPSTIQDFGAVERVEVLKGPQGTLFGRNATGGAINTITKSPDFQKFDTDTSFSIGDYETLKARIYTNIPFTDNFAVNLSLVRSTGNSYYEKGGSTIAGHALNTEVSDGVRLKARYSPIDSVDMTFGYVHSDSNGNGAFPENLNPSPLAKALLISPAHGYTSHVDTDLYSRTTLTVEYLQTTWNSPWFDVKLSGNRQRITSPYNYDFDGSVHPYVSFDIPVHYARIGQSEFQILSNNDSWGHRWLTYAAGAYYYESKQGFDPINVTVGNLDTSDLAADGITLPGNLNSALQSFLHPIIGGTPSASPLYRVQDTALTGTHSVSEYFQATAKLYDWVSLTLGARYNVESRGVVRSDTQLSFFNPNDPNTPIVTEPLITWTEARTQTGTPIGLHTTTYSFKPKVSLDFHPFEDDTLVYTTYQQAIKGQTYNSYAIYLPPEYVSPEKTTAYEVGAKSTLFGGTTRISAAVFRYDIKDLQTQFVSLINGGAVSFENVPKSQVIGTDFDLTSNLSYIWTGLAVNLNGAYLHTKYVSYPNAAGYKEPTFLFSHDNNYTGNRITRSPKFSGSLTPSKTFDVPGGSLEVGGDVYYNSGFFYTAANDPKNAQPSYVVAGARVSYLYEPWKLRGSFAVRNLNGEFYTAGLITTDFGGNYTIAPPREFSLKLDWNF